MERREVTVEGFPVVVENSRPDISTDFVLERLDESLRLIATYLPARFRRLRRDIAQIAVVRFPCRGAFIPDTRTCVAELTFLANMDFTPAQIAASIVHEGMHARLHSLGLARHNPSKEERLCRQAEIELGVAVPGGEAVIDRARAALALSDADVAPAIDWHEAAARVAQVDAAALGRGG
ncbi:MAG TPA: hypothetical protein VEI06_07445 [Gemmatimonadaceae bacterium]|nr:hypothetical protein [Gemmatimonadaceae bacterium]